MIKNLFYFTVVSILISCNSNSDANQGMKTGASSGYQYQVYHSPGGKKPKVGDFVYFNMDIFNDEGELLQTTRNQEVQPSMKILELGDPNRKGNAIADILPDLSSGDSVGIFIPTDSIANLPPGFEDVAHIEYRVVTGEILSEEENQAKVVAIQQELQVRAAALKERYPAVEALASQTVRDYKAEKLELQRTPSGVKYFIHERGDGVLPTNDRMVGMQYYGSLVKEEKKFDDSFNRGRAFTFRLGRGTVIKGWDDAIRMLPVGTKASLFIPSELGYGEQGFPPDIPGGSELYFYVEVEDLLY